MEDIGAQLVKNVANKTNDIAGDGTTTATILTRAIFSEGCKRVAAGINPMDLRRGINAAVDAVVQQLEKITKRVETSEEIEQVRYCFFIKNWFTHSFIFFLFKLGCHNLSQQ